MAEKATTRILPLLKGREGKLRMMRFWSKVDIRSPEACWEWQASLNSNGYGRFKIASYNMVTASRVALISHTGQEPVGSLALHTCDNRRCCNPHHLYWGTHQDNMDDKVARGRCYGGDQSGVKNGAAKLNEEQFALVVQRLKDGWPNTRIAADLPISHSMVSLIRLGKLWRKDSERLGWTPKAQFQRNAA